MRGIAHGSLFKILTTYAIPSLRQRFLSYGSRAYDKSKVNNASEKSGTAVSIALDRLATYQVPHSWFTHFYIASVMSSVIWAYQLASKGALFRIIAERTPTTYTQSMTIEQVWLVWLLMLAQGVRRLYECISLSKPSQSRMWIAHWVLGLSFYVFMGIAVWIEGIRKKGNIHKRFSS